MKKPKLLDLFCGAGGAAVGYHRAGFEVEGVDIKPQPHYPFKFYLADALEFPLEGYDCYHASPPCQKWSGLADVTKHHTGKFPEHPDLIAPTREILIATGKHYVIENVTKSPLNTVIILCGASMGLRCVQRHRHFETSFMIFQPKCSHTKEPQIYGVYGKLNGRAIFPRKEYRTTYAARDIEHARELLGIDWMDDGEIQEAIPPAYTEYIGKYLMQCLLTT